MNAKTVSDHSYRDQEWLENLLALIWYEHFRDISQTNQVRIRYGRRAKRRLGSISLDQKDGHTSIITVNRIFVDLDIPEYVIRATIVHELTHYAHGFNSPHDQKHQYPHSGGVIRAEFAERGLEQLYLDQKVWLKRNWPQIISKHFPPAPRRGRTAKMPLPWWLRGM